MTFDEASHEFVESLVPIGAAAVWDECAAYSLEPVPAWEDQDEWTRARFVKAFTMGLEAMAGAAEAL